MLRMLVRNPRREVRRPDSHPLLCCLVGLAIEDGVWSLDRFTKIRDRPIAHGRISELFKVTLWRAVTFLLGGDCICGGGAR